MKNLFIYHPGSGTFISLADPVYLIDVDAQSDNDLDTFEMGSGDQHFASVRGCRIDNYNMTNLFFGKENQ